MFCCDGHEGHLVGCSSDVSDVTSVFAALVKINGDNSAASEMSASSRTIFKLLLSVLTKVWDALLPSRRCRLRMQPRMFDKFQSPVASRGDPSRACFEQIKGET